MHLTTVHPRDDARILLKEARTLAAQWPVSLIVADGKGPRHEGASGNSLTILDLGQLPQGHVRRGMVGAWRAFRAVRRLGRPAVHFHDPELIPVGMVLKSLGYKVIYDVHEDVPRHLLTKEWLPRILQQSVAWGVSAFERIAAAVFDGIVPATPKIAERFVSGKTVVVQNFPILAEFDAVAGLAYCERPPAFAYVGGITALRGAREMLDALDRLNQETNARLELAGNIYPALLLDELRALPAWGAVNFHGYISRSQVVKLMGTVRGGLVVLQPTPSYVDSYPVKMFEYMAAGIPVIASDFPVCRKIIETAECGLVVNPHDPRAIAAAMGWILSHPQEAESMGDRGRRAVERVYNWNHESIKLLTFYERLLNENDTKTRSVDAASK